METTQKIWTQNDSIEAALNLPEGRYAADFGFLVQQSVSPDNVIEAAQAFKESGKEVMVASQSALLVKAQEEGIAFQDWASTLVLV